MLDKNKSIYIYINDLYRSFKMKTLYNFKLLQLQNAVLGPIKFRNARSKIFILFLNLCLRMSCEYGVIKWRQFSLNNFFES